MTYQFMQAFWANDRVLDLVYQILVLNSRLFLLLAICFGLIRLFKGSAASRHLMITTAFCAAILLPLTTQLIPAVEIVIEVDVPISTVSAQTVSTQDPLEIETTRNYWKNWAPVLLLSGYLLIAAMLLARIVWSNVVIAALSRRASTLSLQSWQQTINECTDLLGIDTTVSIRHSAEITSPMTWGFTRAVILIPSSALRWPEEMKRSALLHELAHIKRNDCFGKQFARFVCALYWINPLCWIGLSRFSYYAESASDDMALNSGIKLSHYAENLLNVAIEVKRRPTQWSAGVAMAAVERSVHRCQLSARVLAILDPEGCRTPINWRCLSASFVMVLGFLLPISSLTATVVEQVNYVVTDPRQLIPLQQARPRSMATSTKVFGAPENVAAIDPVAYRRLLMENILTKPSIEDIHERYFVEDPAIEILEFAKNKVRQNLSALRADTIAVTENSEIPPTVQSTSQTTVPTTVENFLIAANEDSVVETFIPIDIASVVQTHNSVDRHFAVGLAAINIKQPKIEPYSAQRVITPSYPRRAQARGIEGELLVKFDIDSRGQVSDAKIINAQPGGVFDRAVLKALEQSRFNPQKIDGKAVAVSGVQERYVFVLES